MVPLFGDMQIAPFNYVKKTKNFDQSKWPMAMAASNSYATKDVYLSINKTKKILIEYVRVLSNF